MLPNSWRAVRSVNVQARVTDPLAVSWTVRNVELVVCSKTLVAAYRGAYRTSTSDLRDGTEAEHLDFQADARTDLRTLLIESYCSMGSRDIPNVRRSWVQRWDESAYS